MDNLETNTMILEQCRLDMDNLAVLGATGMNEAVVKAEKRARTCNQELRQASKAVELTAKQKKTVEDARLAGEEKLSTAAQDEEDARLAAETVKRMIDDASNVRGASNKDTARILQRAEAVLDDTYQRAVRVYQDKKSQREEIEAAMLRLYATEKAVLYTMAKAERNEGEKLLAKIIADKKHQVCAAEYEVLLLAATEEELREKADDRQSALRRLEEEMRLANERVEQAAGDLDQATADFASQISACEKRSEEEHDALLKEQKQYQKLQESTQLELMRAESLLEEKQTDQTARKDSLAQTQTQIETELEAAQQERTASIAEEDRQLDLLRDQVSRNQEALTEAEAKYATAQAEADRLRGLVNDFTARAAEAEAEEVSARDAAETANRLAQNATKIRESISSESSQLLFHAQEVLLEAAASAQQLMDEKSLLRVAAQNESDRIGKQAALAENTAKQASELVEMKKSACKEAEENLTKAEQLAEIQKAHFQTVLETAQDAAKERLAQAEALVEKAKSAVDEAMQNRDNVQRRLSDLNSQIEDVERRIQAAQAEGEERRLQLQNQADQEIARLESQCRLAEAKVADLQSNYDQEQAALASLERDITNIVAQIETSTVSVREIIDAGVAAIQVADEDVQRLCEEEKLAHQHAEEAVSQMSSVAQGQTKIGTNSDALANLAELIVEGVPADAADNSLAEQAAGRIPDEVQALDLEKASSSTVSLQLENAAEENPVDLAEEETKFATDFERIFAQADTLKDLPSQNKTVEVDDASLSNVVAEAQETGYDELEKDIDDTLEPADLPAGFMEQTPVTDVSEKEILPVDDISGEELDVEVAQQDVRDLEQHDSQPLPADAGEILAEPAIYEEASPLIPEGVQPIFSISTPTFDEEPLIQDLIDMEQEIPLQKNVEDLAVQNASDEEPKAEYEEALGHPQERPIGGEVDEVAQAVRDEVGKIVSQRIAEKDGDEPYDVKEFTADLKPVLERNLGDAETWRMTEMSEAERGRSERLEDISAQLLEHTIIPVEEEESHHFYQPSDWLTNLARSLGEEPDPPKEEKVAFDSEKDTEDAEREEIDLEPLIGTKEENSPKQNVSEGQIKVPQLELPLVSNEEESLRQSILQNESTSKPVAPKKRRFLFFN